MTTTIRKSWTVAALPFLCAASCTKPDTTPAVIATPVEITRVQYVPIPAELTQPVPVYERQNQTCGEHVLQAEANTAAARTCNAQLRAVESIQGTEKEQ